MKLGFKTENTPPAHFSHCIIVIMFVPQLTDLSISRPSFWEASTDMGY